MPAATWPPPGRPGAGRLPHPPGLPETPQRASPNEDGSHDAAACPEGAGSKPPPVD